jgi:DNA-binding MarR family transcriptional regulator
MSDLSRNAHRLVRLFEQMRGSRTSPAIERLNAINISFSHVRAMHMLMPDRTLPMKELAEQLHLAPPSVTALTRRLVQTGLIRREPHPQDSRVSLLSLTDQGKDLLQELYQEHLRRMEQLLGGLSPEEQEVFLDLLGRAVGALSSDADEMIDRQAPDSTEGKDNRSDSVGPGGR